MKASLEVAGIEIAISAPEGYLETLIATRYAPFLGSVRSPACVLRLEPFEPGCGPGGAAAVRPAGEHRVELRGASFEGVVDLQGDGVVRTRAEASATDELLRTLLALLAPRHDGILVRGSGVISAGRAEVFVGPQPEVFLTEAGRRQAVLRGGCVLLRLNPAHGWLASSVPFGSPADRFELPRTAQLGRIFLGRPPAFVPDVNEAPESAEQLLKNVHPAPSDFELASGVRSSRPPVGSQHPLLRPGPGGDRHHRPDRSDHPDIPLPICVCDRTPVPSLER